MPTYIIERDVPGAGRMTDEELHGIATKSNEVVSDLSRPYTWHYSFIADDKIYCVHEAESAEDVIEHARRGGFPANLVTQVARVVDSGGPRGLPV